MNDTPSVHPEQGSSWPRARVEGPQQPVVAKGNDRNSGYDRDALDWYCEDGPPVDALLDAEDFTGHMVWDPSCGRGNILDRCKARGIETYGSDVVDRGAVERHVWMRSDFLRDPLPAYLDVRPGFHIICNPPYGRLEANMPRGDTYAERFIRRALSPAIGAEKVAMIVNGKFLWSERRWKLFHVDHPPTQILFCSDRPSMPPGAELPRLIAAGKAFEGGAIDYVWLLWVRGAERRPPRWLRPRSAAPAAPTLFEQEA